MSDRPKITLRSLVMPILLFGVRCHYRSITFRGKGNIPTGEPCILTPCHQQTIMDPLMVLSLYAFSHRREPVFLARADIFSRKIVQRTHSFLRILPVYRSRDGYSNMSRNNEVFATCRHLLEDGTPICLMAEGRHNNRHQLLPLGKGAFRIAMETQKKLGQRQLMIVPIGIDYDTYERPYGNVIVNVGKPIGMMQFMQPDAGNEAQMMNNMRGALSHAISSLMLDIRSNEHYDEIHTLCLAQNKRIREAKGLPDTPWNRFAVKQEIAARMQDMPSDDPNGFDLLATKARQHKALCDSLHISEDLPSEHLSPTACMTAILCILAAATLAVAIPLVRMSLLFWLLCFPLPLLPTHLIFKKMRIDPQFKSSFNFLLRYFFTIAYTIVMGITVTVNKGFWMNDMVGIGAWWGAVAGILVVIGAAITGKAAAFLSLLADSCRFLLSKKKTLFPKL